MATKTATKPATAPAEKHEARPNGNAGVPSISRERLPYHPAIEERFGIDRASWRALVEAVFPLAQSIDSVLMALSYCRARKLDPFKRVVHIVPIWDSNAGRMVDTVWPGIGELRTTAFRTAQYAGRARTEFGPDVTMKLGSVEITFPEWAQVTVYRMIDGQRVAFEGPQVYWLETYAERKRNDPSPNSMWAKRPRGQIDKCAEAAALRAAFPEEVGNEYCAEEAHSIVLGESTPAPRRVEGESRTDQVAALLADDEGQESTDADVQPDTNTDSEVYFGLRQRITDTSTGDELAPLWDEVSTAVDQRQLTPEQAAALSELLNEREAELSKEPEPVGA